jgi:hypothetical protein
VVERDNPPLLKGGPEKGCSVSDPEDTREEAEDIRAEELGETLESGFRQSFQDFPEGLGQTLGRLRIVGLSTRDVEELGELGQMVIQKGDVEEVAKRIRARQGASTLALTIAIIMQDVEVSSQEGAKAARERLLATLLGAFAGLRTRRRRDAVLGAMGGALAVATSPVVQERVEQSLGSWRRWSER